MYGIYFEYQRIARTKSFTVLPSGALECRPGLGERVEIVISPGSWDHVAWEGDDETDDNPG